MTGIYRPGVKLAVASSFEGIVNNGATECALTSFNAYAQMPEGRGKFFGYVIEPKDFVTIRNSEHVAGFLALRPLVGVAEDYVTVLEVLEACPAEVRHMLNHPDEESAYRPLIELFQALKKNAWHAEKRKKFGTGKESAFYRERKRMQDADMTAWMGTQEPYADSIAQFRMLADTQERVEGTANAYEAVTKGFVPWFATSKDEDSTFLLCQIYTQTDRMEQAALAEDGRVRCVISRDRLIGMETVPNRDKVKQLTVIAEREGVPHPQVWRIEDRYDTKQQLELRDAGFHTQFIVPGYMFPHDIRKAAEDRNVVVLDRSNFAAQLGGFAEAWRY